MMKKLMFLLFAGVISAGTVKAQDFGENPEECKKHLSNYGVRWNAKQYVEAVPFIQKVYNTCPKADEGIYTNLRYVYKSLLLPEAKKAGDEARQAELLDSLLWLTDKHMEHFGETTKLKMQKGVDLMQYKAKDEYNAAFEMLGDVMEEMGEETPYYVVVYYFQSAFYKRKNKEVENDFFIDEYMKVSDFVTAKKEAAAEAGDEETEKAWTQTEQQLMKLLTAVINDCKDINRIAETVKSELPEDCEEKAKILDKYHGFIKAFTKHLECDSVPALEEFAMMQFECSPTAKAAYNIGAGMLQKEDYSEALNWFKKAIELCDGCEDEGKFVWAAARTSQRLGNLAGASTYARKCVALGYKTSDAYVIIAKYITTYAGTCGNDIIARKSVYWLASDYMQKAGRGADVYKANYPTTSELFDEAISVGSSYTVPCLGETTTVRAQ